MIDKLVVWNKERILSRTHSPIVFGEHKVWVEKEQGEKMQDQIDSVITMAKLLGYQPRFEKKLVKYEVVNHRYSLKIEMYKPPVVVPYLSIDIRFQGDFVYHLAVKYFIRPNGWVNLSQCHMKYEKFYKCLVEGAKTLK